MLFFRQPFTRQKCLIVWLSRGGGLGLQRGAFYRPLWRSDTDAVLSILSCSASPSPPVLSLVSSVSSSLCRWRFGPGWTHLIAVSPRCCYPVFTWCRGGSANRIISIYFCLFPPERLHLVFSLLQFEHSYSAFPLQRLMDVIERFQCLSRIWRIKGYYDYY